MMRTTIILPDDLGAALDREAERRRESRSEIVREALRRHLQFGTGQRRRIPFAAIGSSNDGRTAAELEDVLVEEWLDHIMDDSFGGRGR